MNLKVRVDHLLLGLGAVVLLVGTLLAWRALRPDPEQAELDEGLERLRERSTEQAGPRKKPRFIRPRGAFSSSAELSGAAEGEGEAVPQAPQQRDPGDLGPDEAVDNFRQVLAELEGAVEDGRRLSELEQAEFYNRATGSFTALSAWVDGDDPTERALMNDAYNQMMALMRELDLEPPSHDPDPGLMRR